MREWIRLVANSGEIMKAAELHAADAGKRKAGKSPTAWIAPAYPEPKTDAEKAVRELIPDLSERYLIHVYDVLELMEKAYEAGVAAAAKKN